MPQGKRTLGREDHLVNDLVDNLRDWVEKGLIDEAQAEAIRSYEAAPIDEREAIQTVEISLFPDLRNLDLVQVLTGGRRQ